MSHGGRRLRSRAVFRSSFDKLHSALPWDFRASPTFRRSQKRCPILFRIPGTHLPRPPAPPPDITSKLAEAITDALARPDVKAKLEASSARAIGGSAAEAAKFIQRESLRWREVIEVAAIKAE